MTQSHKGLAQGRSALATIMCAAMIAGAGSAQADGSSTPYGRGGIPFPQMDAIISQANQSGELFRIEGSCQSSCTTLLAIRKVCIDPSATLKFHAWVRSPDQPVDPVRNQHLTTYYNAKLRSFVVANGYLKSYEFHDISGQDMILKFGYRQCPAR